MAEALSLLLKQLLIYNSDRTLFKKAQARAHIATTFDALMNHLRKMMLGYENQQVHGLLKEIEECGMNKYHFRLGKPVSGKLLEACEKLSNIRFGSTVEAEEIVMGFDEEVETLLHQLTETCGKQLQVISIAGMAGLGKTTLARKLYRDPYVDYFFDFRAWTCVSQVCLKRDLLLGILSSLINDLTDEIYKMSDEQLGEKLYRLLKCRRYFVVLDDIWDCKAWNDLKMYLPDDKTGSRVLFTSRDLDISLHVGEARPAHVLRLRTEAESWDIFQTKVFRTRICPPRLEAFGRVITRKCEGLPLAIIITAGLLKNQSSDTLWREIADSLHSFMVRDPSQYIDSLGLSYNHLPSHIRQCFLFVGVFSEDYDIPVTKLIWLWVAQGFILDTGSRILEDVAEDLLMDLIRRGLLMIAKMRADGHIKACRIHDLLWDLCLRKAKKEIFFPQIYKGAPATASSSTIKIMQHGMFVNPPVLPTYFGFCYPVELAKFLQMGQSILSDTYKPLTIVDMESVPMSLFPSDVIHLANLRYLAIQARDGSPPASISNPSNLQILIISSRKNIVLPKTMWNMVNLRHLYIKSGENLLEEPCFVPSIGKDGYYGGLASLQTLSQVSPQSCQNIFSRTPNLRKLGFCGPLLSSQTDLEFPNLRSLEHLQELKLLNTISYPEAMRSCNPLMFPEKLKKLTLSNTCMDWKEMWTFA